ncbi:MAG: tRNA (guanosine(37)-N1)-methyltransferase TrmD [Bdellovibrionales bacterium]|nr:tRNA (guanosine(37)-N1)-methyltransferase TrmD [Bdellovibrionales bacterium]
MKFQILTLFPEFFSSFIQTGLISKAIQKSIIDIELIDVKIFSDKGRADDYPIGGGESMIISYTPLKKALQSLKKLGHVVCLSPQGEIWNFKKAKGFSTQYKTVTLICGRYGGIDLRLIQDFVHEEISIGDYVLNGGETASLVLIESCSRFLENFMKNRKSHQKDSFENSLLKSPQWTKPNSIEGHTIPKILLSGHHKKIKEFRYYSSLWLTYLKKPYLLEKKSLFLKDLFKAKNYLKQFSPLELKALGLKKEKADLVLIKKK